MANNTTQFSKETRDELSYRIFRGIVTHVDLERTALWIQDERSIHDVYDNVQDFPSKANGSEGTDVVMPGLGAKCLCCVIDDIGGHVKVAVISWLNSGSANGIQAIATRMTKGQEISGWSSRERNVYRKAYMYEESHWNPLGYSYKKGAGWDQQALDLSRDKLDPFRRTHTSITGRNLTHTDSVITQSGPVVRQDGPDCFDVTLPDGSTENILYLMQTFKSQTDPRQRYVKGTPDLIPITENLTRVAEFALDYPLTPELLEDEATLNAALGVNLPISKWWNRTSVSKYGNIQGDDQSPMINQTWDHPENSAASPLGPTLNEGPTPRRRGWIIEKAEGTLVGYNQFDPSTYGKVLKPILFPPGVQGGRFSVDVESAYLPVKATVDQVEVKLAASAMSLRFPYEYNTTRLDITKEGMLSFEVGSTIPKENILWDSSSYEHPHGAGRSIEGHTTGSVKLVLGKNRDEEDSLDLVTLGSTVLRLGSDDTSLPTTRRSVTTQIRGKNDVVTTRDLQWWTAGNRKLKTQGDAGNLENKTAGENVSLRAATDGGMFLRLGARNLKSLRRHFINGYKDGPGLNAYDVADPDRIDSKTSRRLVYGASDANYRFHDLTQVTAAKLGSILPYCSSGDPTAGAADVMGLSADIHAVRDIFIRAGAHDTSKQSLTLDLAGGILAAIGMDTQGRSLSAQFDGGIEATVGPNKQGKAIRLEINGDVDIVIKGHLNLNVTGDISGECNNSLIMSKGTNITRATNILNTAVTGIINEAPAMLANNGLYTS